MTATTKFYIDGAWVDPAEPRLHDVINPATEEPIAKISLGSAKDVDRAVAAARRAFPAWSESSRGERLALFKRIMEVFTKRLPDLAQAISSEMGAPKNLAIHAQAASGLGHIGETARVLESFPFEEEWNSTLIRREAAGVCALITPWNWPINQIACKVAPALAAGCTMVLKPSELAPLNAHIFAEILEEAGVPKGVFNLVHGDGPGVGTAMSSHPDVDMVSFTGSTRAGIEIARNAAPTVKRVSQELGGKSPNIILDDADLAAAVGAGVAAVMINSGQSCNAPARMLVPQKRHDEAAQIAKSEVETKWKVGAPTADNTALGPLANAKQFEKVQRLIQKGIEEGAKVVTGGIGRPEGFNKGYFVRPTVFANVRNDMTVAREEIFGPVITVIPYKDEAEAVRIANDTPYGLSSQVHSGDLARAHRVANKIRAGMVHLNGAPLDFGAPFGGYKQSGNGREWGRFGLEEFLEVKALMGHKPAPAH
jgi:aldehyde dehydrogenase (NAD+)